MYPVEKWYQVQKEDEEVAGKMKEEEVKEEEDEEEEEIGRVDFKRRKNIKRTTRSYMYIVQCTCTCTCKLLECTPCKALG